MNIENRSTEYSVIKSVRSSASESILGAQTKLLAVTKFEIVLSVSMSQQSVRGLREWEERRRLLHDFCFIICQSAAVSTL